jgi:hypothetical protein
MKWARNRRQWVRLLAARGLPPGRIAFVIEVEETVVLDDLAWMRPPRQARLTPPVKNRRRPPEDRPILGQAGRRIRRLAALEYTAHWIAATLALKPDVVADFLRRLEPVRKTELARPRERSEEERMRASQAAAAEREARQRLLTPPAGWTNGDRFATGEAREWAQLMTTLQQARATGAEILGLASKVWFAPARSRADAPAVEPTIWTGPENPYAGSPKLTPEMIAEIIALRLQGWSTGKLAKRYGVTRATICYALTRRTFAQVVLPPPPPFVADPLTRPGQAPPTRPQEDRPQPSRPPVVERDGTSQRFAPEAGWANGDHNATGEASEWKLFLATTAEARDVSSTTSPVIVTPFPFEPAVWIGTTNDDHTPRQISKPKTT